MLTINGSSDRTLKANEFTFLLKDQAGTLIDTKTNGENGDILFNPVSFNEAGTFIYTIVEQKPATPESAITYDESVHTVTVTVTKDANGQLNADVQYDGKRISLLLPTRIHLRHLQLQVKNKLPQVRF